MIVIKDATVLILLAKGMLLRESCEYFGGVVIPQQVKDEVTNDKPDSAIINMLIKEKIITVKKIKNKDYITKANEFNVQRGEAEAVALYWESNANLLATDDDNVRKKRELLQINTIGTPAIMLKMYQKRKISKEKLLRSIDIIKKIGWFSSTIWDKINLEVQNE